MLMRLRERCNLHDELARHSYDHAVLCTYAFDFEFFEQYCLDKFKSLQNNGNITIIVDGEIYRKAISGESHLRPQHANIRYFLHPVSICGRFHPKIFLLLSRDRGKLIFGSANVTRAGITSNAELVSCYIYEAKKKEENCWIFTNVFRYIKEISQKWPSDTLASNISNIERNVPWITRDDAPEKQNLSLLHNLEMPLLGQFIKGIKVPVDRVRILSRYFDQKPSLMDTIMAGLRPKEIQIYTQDVSTTLSKNWFEHRSVKAGRTKIYLCDFKDQNAPQALHAKAISIEKRGFARLVFGSANFTSAALIRTPKNGNAEFIAVLDNLSLKDFRIDSFFDPEKSAFRVTSVNQLSMSEKEKEHRKRYGINITEAQLADNRVLISWKHESNHNLYQFSALISFQEKAFMRIPCTIESDGRLAAQVSGETLRRMNNFSSIVQIEAINRRTDKKVISNPVLVVNLIDIYSGQSVRKARYISEAQQSPGQFSQIIAELLKDSNEEGLLDFLNRCDIPFIDDKRHRFILRRRGNVSEEWMRRLGERNLKYFTVLHDAAIDFLERHLRKLQRHCELCGISGIYNFFHIFMAMADIIHSQIGRALAGFEATRSLLSIDEWGLYRDQMEDYYEIFGQMMDLMWNGYISKLVKLYPRTDINDRVEPDLNQIREICSKMQDFRARFESLRQASIRVKGMDGRVLVPEYFDCLLGKDQWQDYREEIDRNLRNIETVL